MASTVKHQPNSSAYIEVVSGTTNDFFLQNISDRTPVMLIWSSTQPENSSKGHVLDPGDSVVRSGLTGNVWARSLTSDAIVIVTEE